MQLEYSIRDLVSCSDERRYCMSNESPESKTYIETSSIEFTGNFLVTMNSTIEVYLLHKLPAILYHIMLKQGKPPTAASRWRCVNHNDNILGFSVPVLFLLFCPATISRKLWTVWDFLKTTLVVCTTILCQALAFFLWLDWAMDCYCNKLQQFKMTWQK